MKYILKRGVKYENTKIFSVRSHYYDKIYIGYTTERDLKTVLSKYKYRFRLWKLGFVKEEPVFLILDLGGCSIKELERHKCINKEEVNEKINRVKDKYKNSIFNYYIDIPKKTIFLLSEKEEEDIKVEEPKEKKERKKLKEPREKPGPKPKKEFERKINLLEGITVKQDITLEIF